MVEKTLFTNLEGKLVSIDSLYIAADVSATTVRFGIYEITETNNDNILYEANYSGKEVKDFRLEVFDDAILTSKIDIDNVKAMVLAPAGPIRDNGERCRMTNDEFSIDANNFPVPCALINDFRAISYLISADKLGVLDLKKVEIDHIRATNPKADLYGSMAVYGPGTGDGNNSLIYNKDRKIHLPSDSEGGHVSFPAYNNDEFNFLKFLSGVYLQGNPPTYEEVISVRGLERLYEFLSDGEILDSYEIGRRAKDKEIICLTTMRKFAGFVGREARKMALQYKATGGVYITGGVAMHNLWSDGDINPYYCEELIRDFELGPDLNDLIDNVPVYGIVEKECGLLGARACAKIDAFRNNENFYLDGNSVVI